MVKDIVKYLFTISLMIMICSYVYGQEYKQKYFMTISHRIKPLTLPVNEIDSIWFSKADNCYLNPRAVFASFVRTPIFLWGAKVAFFGDSIMKGYVNGKDVTDDNFPNLLDSIYHFEICDNYSISGSTYVKGVREVKTILEQVSSNNNIDDYDIIIIGGGINDWALGVSLESFEDAINHLVEIINTSSNKCRIIVITPIDCAALVYGAHPIEDLQVYRNIVSKVILDNDKNERYSIIQGNEFGFPNNDYNTEFSDIMFGDKLHPSELGYKTLFLAGFLRALY